MHRAMIRSAVVCAAVIFVVIGGTQPAGAGSRWHSGKKHSHTRETLQYGLAVFEWHQLSRLDDEVAPRLRWLRAQGFTTVYADFGEYIEAADQPGGDERDDNLARLGRHLRRFVAYASSLGFEVHAVGGAPNWIDEFHNYLGPGLVRLVADYNAGVSREERLRGVQVDIEPHADPAFSNVANQPTMLLAWLETLQSIVDTYREVREGDSNRRLRLGFAIPFWFDDEQGSPAPVEFGDAADPKPATFHLFDMLVDLSDAYVVVLSYRNFTGGDDGSIAHARREFDYANADTIPAQFGIVVGQEFTNVRPEKVTFWCRGRAAFRQAAAKITAELGIYPQFRGLSVNDLDAYLATPEYVVSSRSRIMGGWRTSPRCYGLGAGSPFVTGT
jgi:hypothetical protein